MCYGCWEGDYEASKLDSESIRHAVELIGVVYSQPNGSAGGGLHIVVDDWNLGDSSIQWCIDNGLTDTETKCATQLLSLTEKERASALARYDGYIT